MLCDHYGAKFCLIMSSASFAGVAYRNNKVTQRKILEEGGIPILVQLLLMPPNTDVQVEVAITLACVVLGNRTNQEKLSEEPGFRHDILLNLLHSHKEVSIMMTVRLETSLSVCAVRTSIYSF